LATPDNVLPVSGRLWLASTTSSPGGFPASTNAWLPGTGFNPTDNFIGEGQISHSPGEGLVILPKVRLQAASGSIPHPAGRIGLRLQRVGGTHDACVSLPPGLTATVICTGCTTTLTEPETRCPIDV
jgi:hypothetical protein